MTKKSSDMNTGSLKELRFLIQRKEVECFCWTELFLKKRKENKQTNPQNQTKQKPKTQQTKIPQTNKTPPNQQNPNKGKTQPANTKTPNPQTNQPPKSNKQPHPKVVWVINSTSQWVFLGEIEFQRQWEQIAALLVGKKPHKLLVKSI